MADVRTESAGEWLRTALIIAAAIGLAKASAGVALAHKGKLPTDALSLVRQAAALLAQDPKLASGDILAARRLVVLTLVGLALLAWITKGAEHLGWLLSIWA